MLYEKNARLSRLIVISVEKFVHCEICCEKTASLHKKNPKSTRVTKQKIASTLQKCDFWDRGGNPIQKVNSQVLVSFLRHRMRQFRISPDFDSIDKKVILKLDARLSELYFQFPWEFP